MLLLLSINKGTCKREDFTPQVGIISILILCFNIFLVRCSMDKEFLEHQYSPSRWSKVDKPDEIITKHCKIIIEESKHALEDIPNETDVKYGSQDGEKMDIFFCKNDRKEQIEAHLTSPCTKSNSPILMFLHGGYWQELGKEYYSYIGKTFANHGITTIITGYDLAPKVKLATIFDEIKDSVVYVKKRFPSSRITVVGHSAGAHLAALLLTVDWASLGISSNPITAVVPISGVYDLRPLVNTYINDPLKMDEGEAWTLSPMKYIHDMELNSQCHVLCMIAEQESPEFHKQSQNFYEALKTVGLNIQLEVIKNTDHFSVMHNFAYSDYKPTKQIVDLVYDVGVKE